MERRSGVTTAACAALLAFILIPAFVVAAPARGPIPIFGVAFPDRVAGAPRGEVHDFEKTQPGLGQSVGYRRKDWKIDVFIYDLKRSSIPGDPSSPVIKDQLAQAKGDILAAEKRGHYADVIVRGEYTINDTKGRQRFSCLTFNYRRNKVPVDSYLCLTGVNNKFFKLRMTALQNPASVAFARQFVEAWIPVLWPQ